MPFFITFLASFSTMLGALPIFIKKNKNIIIFALGFAGGVMISVSLFDLVKESFVLLNQKYNYIGTVLYILLFINVGIIISSVFKSFIPDNNLLYRVGIISMLAIIMHNIPEGIITYITSKNNLKLGVTLAIAIALHNIPEGITIALPIYYATNKKRRAVVYTFISGFSEFFGAIFAFIFLNSFINNIILGYLYSAIAGIMLYISCTELIPTSLRQKNTNISIFSCLLGVIMTLIV